MPTQALLEACKVCWWTPMPRRSPPSVQETQIALRREDFVDRVTGPRGTSQTVDHAQEIPWSSAFRRAIGNLENKDLKASFKSEGSVLHGQLDRVSLGERGRQIRTLEAHWKLEGGDNPRVVYVEGVHGTSAEAGIGDPSLSGFRTLYQWGDLSLVVMSVIAKHGFGAYSIRKAGGVYFIPIRSNELLDKLERACAEINLNFMQLPIPDREESRAEIEEAIFTALETEIQVHREAIAEYHEQTKRGHITNRQEALADTRRLVDNVGAHLRSRRAELVRQLDEVVAQCVVKLTAVDAALNQPRAVGGGRRNIMTRVS